MKHLFLSAIFFLLGNLYTDAQTKPTYVMHPHEELPSLDMTQYQQVFLAGTIDMGNSIDWQAKSEERLKEKGGFVIYNPRQKEWHPEREGEMDYQVNWELEHLEKADVIIMYFANGSQSPITLLELGLFAKSGKLKVVCTDKFYRYDNVRITCARYGVPINSTLNEVMELLTRNEQ